MGTRIFRNTAVTSNPSGGVPGLSVRKVGGLIDIPLLLIMAVFLVFGLVILFSASYDYSLAVYKDPMHMFNRQLIWMALGIVLAFSLSRVDYHRWKILAVIVMGGTIALLVTVLLVNEMRLGAVRTLLDGSIQPSELAKVVIVIYLAVWMDSKREQLQNLEWGLIPLIAILGIVGGLIFLQPDLSATATVFMLGGVLFFLGGGHKKQILMLLIGAVVVGVLVVQVSHTGRTRINDYLTGLKDPTQSSYHMLRSYEAIVKGGWFGVGIGQASTKLTGLPLAPTDSIFAVIVEELGLVGAGWTVLLYGLLIWRGLRIANRAPDMLGSLLASGVTFWIATDAIINMMVMVGLMPFAGNALPFISSGGSNLVTSLIAVGILMGVSRQMEPESGKQEWRNFGSSIDLRGRNRRRSISRLGGS
jgi:cell division protein FtsW